MRIFNGTNSQINLPLVGTDRLTVLPHSLSENFMPNPDVLGVIVSSYDEKEIALVASGPLEISMCSATPTCAPLVVESEEQALERFGLAEKKEEK